MEISEIKTLLSLARVLHYYQLKPDKNLRLNCPFHEDKTPGASQQKQHKPLLQKESFGQIFVIEKKRDDCPKGNCFPHPDQKRYFLLVISMNILNDIFHFFFRHHQVKHLHSHCFIFPF